MVRCGNNWRAADLFTIPLKISREKSSGMRAPYPVDGVETLSCRVMMLLYGMAYSRVLTRVRLPSAPRIQSFMSKS